ncbi:MAG TPA: glycoside hydrolase family 38 C-terminal domain-containing protein, partial [Nitrolancea sp.]|nr:glycoside hydrolase family 38 C-terminal domain-containing protein [Nitrolancea sp.]
PHLVRALDAALARLELPRDQLSATEAALLLHDELARLIDVARSLSRHYSYDTPLHAIEHQLREAEHLARDPAVRSTRPLAQLDRPRGVAEALATLRGELSTLAQRFPAQGRLATSAHAHLDVAWLWPLAETRRKAHHTFASVLSLMERYPDFHFTASSAQLYDYVQTADPELFERVRARVAEGRWEPIGGMWIEPDCNLTSGESLVRQLILGRRYFAREFGYRDAVAWLPDTFGFAANLPQILAGAGIRFFFTHKLNWNDTNRFPYDLWRWEGIDGTQLTAHSFDNPIGGYNGQITPDALGETWRNFRGKARHAESLFTFGMGDGGRGPTSDMLERIALLNDVPALPTVRQTTVKEFFEQIDPASLPVWTGELYLEFHRGTYTTQSRIKRLNRLAEHRLYEAEAAATLAAIEGALYPRTELSAAWTTLARNQFHDILPGSSIREVNVEAERELGGVVDSVVAVRDRAIDRLTGSVRPKGTERQQVVFFNPQSFRRLLSGAVERPATTGPFRLILSDGIEVPWQPCDDDTILIHVDRRIHSFGFALLDVLPEAPITTAGGVAASGRVLENNIVRVELADDGTIASLFDKRTKREMLSGPANQLRLYHDLPAAWEAWNLTDTSQQEGRLIDEYDAWRVVENGPVRASIEIRRSFGTSTIIQRYSLRVASPRLDIETEIDWHERRTLLRALFPLAIHAPHATFETSYGAIKRSTRRNTSWERAQYEVPGHRWVDLSEPDYGVSLLNDGRYGHSALGNTLGLTLLRSPLDPDPLADRGHHTFTYALYPHVGDWATGGTIEAAIDLNSPLIGRLTSTAQLDDPINPRHWFDISGMTVGALKLAEDSDDIILRLYDPYGRHGTAVVTPYFDIAGAAIVDLLEENPTPIDLRPSRAINVSYRPFQILTLRLRRS